MNSVRPENAIGLFLEYNRQRHLSEKTIRANRIILQHLADYCCLNGLADLRDAIPETLLDYYRWVKQRKRPDGKPLSMTYINCHAYLAKALFKFLADRNYIMNDIGKNFPPLHDPAPLPRGIMNKDEVMRLLQQPYLTTPLGFRDRTMLEVLYSTGLRGGVAAGVKIPENAGLIVPI
ncbi:hypothetical protein EPN27_03900 [Patescibacteria group bacterium]|nr:MAG: hypothetical protein EPN27_03900 [Patescibacteria group bacterium]